MLMGGNRGERKTGGRGREGGASGGRSGGRFGGPHRRERKDDIFAARMRKKTCRFCEEKVDFVDYKDTRRFERLVSERGKILSRRITGVCARHQRKVEDAVKKARFMAILPFVKK